MRDYFGRPVTILVGKRTLRATPKQLGAIAHAQEAIKRARLVLPGRNVPLKVTVKAGPLERYVAKIAERFERAPVEARLFCSRLDAVHHEGQAGRTLNRVLLERALVRG